VKLFSEKKFKQLKKHPIIVGFSLILILIGVLQSFTWVYDRFLKTEATAQLNEQEIISKLTPGVTDEFIKNLIGPPQKSMDITNGSEVFFWDLNNNIIGVIFEEKNVNTLAIYSKCFEPTFVYQLNFTLCNDDLPETNGNFYEWDSFLGVQNIGYIEAYLSDRSSYYLSSFFGAENSAFELIQFVDKNKEYFDSLENKLLDPNDSMTAAVINLRKNIKPNLIILSNKSEDIDNLMEIYYRGLMNFPFLSN